jgi:hypothetical protein
MSAVMDQRAAASGNMAGGDPRLDALVGRLPSRVAGTVSYLLKPSSRWVRLPAGALLIVGGLLSFLPVLGIWMLPLGLALLAERRAGAAVVAFESPGLDRAPQAALARILNLRSLIHHDRIHHR